MGREHIETRLREVKEICQYFLGLDPVEDLIPVRPAQHYSMGGVRTGHTGESIGLQGLFAAGEVACWDLHGFNRLGGNSVAETVVAGMIVSEFMADFLSSDRSDMSVSSRLVEESYRAQQQILSSFQSSSQTENPFHIMRAMQEIMSEHVAIFRNHEKLTLAISELDKLQDRAQSIRVHSSARGANPELVAAYRVQRMLKLALCVAHGALQRKESRGAHYREDFPLRNDRDWLNRTLATWSSSDNCPILSYEALNINSMESPPNWRGYGSKERIDHVQTALRQQQVDTVIAQHATESSDRFMLQEKLMPYQHLLPEYLRAKNGRYREEV